MKLEVHSVRMVTGLIFHMSVNKFQLNWLSPVMNSYEGKIYSVHNDASSYN